MFPISNGRISTVKSFQLYSGVVDKWGEIFKSTSEQLQEEGKILSQGILKPEVHWPKSPNLKANYNMHYLGSFFQMIYTRVSVSCNSPKASRCRQEVLWIMGKWVYQEENL